MTAVRGKWAEMDWYRRILLLVTAAMTLIFGIATMILSSRFGMEYQDTLFYAQTEGENCVYRGTLDWKEAVFTAAPDGTVTYRWGEYDYGPYQVSEDPTAVPDGFRSGQGIEIRLGSEVLFRGNYEPGPFITLTDENGEPFFELHTYAVASDGTIMEDGRVISEKEYRAPSLPTLAEVAFGPELTHRGNIGIFLLVMLLAVFNIFQICFPGFFFRLSLLGHVQNIDDAEPSDFYIAMERLEWLVLAGMCLVLYWMATTAIW